MNRAALQIQNQWRAYMSLKKIGSEYESGAALVIQKLWRGFRERKCIICDGCGHILRGPGGEDYLPHWDFEEIIPDTVYGQFDYDRLERVETGWITVYERWHPDLCAECHRWEESDMFVAAEVIQKHWRGFKVRSAAAVVSAVMNNLVFVVVAALVDDSDSDDADSGYRCSHCLKSEEEVEDLMGCEECNTYKCYDCQLLEDTQDDDADGWASHTYKGGDCHTLCWDCAEKGYLKGWLVEEDSDSGSVVFSEPEDQDCCGHCEKVIDTRSGEGLWDGKVNGLDTTLCLDCCDLLGVNSDSDSDSRSDCGIVYQTDDVDSVPPFDSSTSTESLVDLFHKLKVELKTRKSCNGPFGDETTMFDKLIEDHFLEQHIVYNWYKPSHLGIHDWGCWKIRSFKKYMANVVCGGGDELRDILLEMIQNFEADSDSN